MMWWCDNITCVLLWYHVIGGADTTPYIWRTPYRGCWHTPYTWRNPYRGGAHPLYMTHSLEEGADTPRRGWGVWRVQRGGERRSAMCVCVCVCVCVSVCMYMCVYMYMYMYVYIDRERDIRMFPNSKFETAILGNKMFPNAMSLITHVRKSVITNRNKSSITKKRQ